MDSFSKFTLKSGLAFKSFKYLIMITLESFYRLTFLPVENNRGQSRLMIIELKVSVGDLGEIYEDGHQKVCFLIAISSHKFYLSCRNK